MYKKQNTIFGINDDQIEVLLKKYLDEVTYNKFIAEVEEIRSLGKSAVTLESLLSTTTLYKLPIPMTCENSLARSSYNRMVKIDHGEEILNKLVSTSRLNNRKRFILRNEKFSEEELNDISKKYYSFFGATSIYDICTQNSSEKVRQMGDKNKRITIEAYQILKDQLEYLLSSGKNMLTGDETLIENCKRNITSVEINFPKIVDLLNRKAMDTGGIILFKPSGLLETKKDQRTLEILATYSDEETNNGYLAGVDGNSGFTKLIRKI